MKQSELLIVCAVAAAAGYYFWKIKPTEAVKVAPIPSADGAALQAQVGQLQAEIDAAKAVVPGPT
jgi:hypothetical protein